MGKIKVDTVTNLAGTGAPNISDGVTIGGVALASVNKQEHYAQSAAPTSPADGAVWYDTDDDKAYVYINSEFYELTYTNLPTNAGNRGVFGGGDNGSGSGTAWQNVIDYISIPTAGNATDFGNLTQAISMGASASNGNRGVFAGGLNGSTVYNIINYITIASAGNATDFGDLTVARRQVGGCSDSSRGVFGGGNSSGGANNYVDVIDYITIASTGNATDFGNLTVSRGGVTAEANLTRALFGGGHAPSNVIDYITVASAGNATDFGDLTIAIHMPGSCSSLTRALFAGGYIGAPSYGNTNTIQYVTIASTGNATDFGDLTLAAQRLGGTSNHTRGVFAAGKTSESSFLPIDYVTIDTTGNATDFGDLSVSRYGTAACSGD